MTELADEYLKARAEFIQVQGKLRRIRDTVTTVAQILHSRPDHLIFRDLSSADPRVGKGRVEIAAEDWPTAEQLQALLVRWRGARKRMLDCWRRLPRDQQATVERPLKIEW